MEGKFLLQEEIDMWLRIGIYITTDPLRDHNLIQHVILYDGMGNEAKIGVITGRNIRRSVLAWWQVERVKPRAKEPREADAFGLSELENRSE